MANPYARNPGEYRLGIVGYKRSRALSKSFVKANRLCSVTELDCSHPSGQLSM